MSADSLSTHSARDARCRRTDGAGRRCTLSEDHTATCTFVSPVVEPEGERRGIDCTCPSCRADGVEARAEAERLQDQLLETRRAFQDWYEVAGRRAGEIRRLRDRVHELELSLGCVCGERDEARAEVERLRGAIRCVWRLPEGDVRNALLAALAGKGVAAALKGQADVLTRSRGEV